MGNTGFSAQDLENLLNMLLVTAADYYPVRNSLLEGDLVPANLKGGMKILIEADPVNRTLNIYTPDKRLIPTNLRLDPDWQSPAKQQSVEIKAANKEVKSRQNYRSFKRVGGRRSKGI